MGSVAWSVQCTCSAAFFQELEKFKTQATAATLDAVKFPHETHNDVACRFMRARKFSVEDAITMVKACQISGASDVVH